MNKTQLVQDISDRLKKSGLGHITHNQVGVTVDATITAISDALRSGEDVVLTGFGSFKPKVRGARRGRNPKTGEAVDIPAHTVVQFTAGKGLKEAVNE